MKLSIIIPTRDRGEIFNNTLRCAIEAIQHLDAEVLVINDSKVSKPVIPAGNERIKLVDNPNSGVASARNVGVRLSAGEILLFLDDDIIISKNSVDHVLSLHQQLDDACINVNWEYPSALQKSMETSQLGRFMITHRLTSFKGWYSHSSWRDNELFRSKAVASFHLSISRSNFAKTRGYNEKFPYAGFEDYDFPMQLKEAGLSLYIDSRVTVFHNEKDRIKLGNWLANLERRSFSRRKAVSLGYPELALSYTPIKIAVLKFVLFSSGIIRSILKLIPSNRIFDPLCFKLISVLQVAYIYKGYTSHQAR